MSYPDDCPVRPGNITRATTLVPETCFERVVQNAMYVQKQFGMLEDRYNLEHFIVYLQSLHLKLILYTQGAKVGCLWPLKIVSNQFSANTRLPLEPSSFFIFFFYRLELHQKLRILHVHNKDKSVFTSKHPFCKKPVRYRYRLE